MARTARKKISVYDEGVLLVDDVDSLNFTGVNHSGSAIGRDVTENFPGGGAGSNVVFGEVVAGSVTTFTLAHVPVGAISLAANGQTIYLTTDYTIVGAVITTLTPWSAGALIANYKY